MASRKSTLIQNQYNTPQLKIPLPGTPNAFAELDAHNSGPRVEAIVSIVESCRRLSIPIRDYLGSVLPEVEVIKLPSGSLILLSLRSNGISLPSATSECAVHAYVEGQ